MQLLPVAQKVMVGVRSLIFEVALPKQRQQFFFLESDLFFVMRKIMENNLFQY